MRMTGLKRMIGLPVILNGRPAGCVVRGVLTEDGRGLRGIVLRGGLRELFEREGYAVTPACSAYPAPIMALM